MKNETMSRNGRTRNGRTTLRTWSGMLDRVMRTLVDDGSCRPDGATIKGLRQLQAHLIEERDAIPKGSASRPTASASDFLDEMERRRVALDAAVRAANRSDSERLLWCRRYAEARMDGVSGPIAVDNADEFVERYREGCKMWDGERTALRLAEGKS